MISVVTPVLNGRACIEGCLANVRDQGITDLEHIIVDGGSTDETMAVVRARAETTPGLRWISELDRGQSHAMNKGVAMARGDLIGILNVDDRYELGALARVGAAAVGAERPALLVGDCNVWDAAHRLTLVNRPGRMTLFDLLLGWDANQFPVNPSAYFAHRELYAVVGGFDESDHYSMDLDFILRAVQVARIVRIDAILGNYHMLPLSKTVIEMRRGKMLKRQQWVFRRFERRLSAARRGYLGVMRKWGRLRSSLHFLSKDPTGFTVRGWARMTRAARGRNA